MTYRYSLWVALVVVSLGRSATGQQPSPSANWYERSFFLLHEDHHTQGTAAVGRDADPVATAAAVAMFRPDVVQIHAKGNPGWTTYPTDIGHTPPQLARDVLQVWRGLARDAGYHWSIYYNIGRDGEIMQRRPEWNRVQANGKPWERALAYNTGVAEQYLWPMIEEIQQKYQPDGFWFDGSVFTVSVSYDQASVQRFQTEQGLPAPRKQSDPGWREFHELHRQVYREFVDQSLARIHARDPKCLVAFNWAYSLRMPEQPAEGIAYLTGDIADRIEGLSAEAHWYDSTGLPFDLMTTGHAFEPKGQDPVQGSRTILKPQPHIQQEMAIIIANGGRYFLWDNPTATSGISQERAAWFAKVVAPFLRSRQAWCLGSQRIPDVSLLHNAASHYRLAAETTQCFRRQNNRLDGAAEQLPRLHLNYEMVGDWRLLADDVRSGLLIVEHPAALTGESIVALRRFVTAGGKLLLTGMAVTLDRQLEELAGVESTRAPAPPEQLQVTCGSQTWPVRAELQRVRASSAKQLLSVTTASGEAWPWLVRNTVGKGTVYYSTTPLLSRPGADLPEPLLEDTLEIVLPAGDRLVETTAPPDVEVVLRKQAERYILHMVNAGRGNRRSFPLETRSTTLLTKLPPVPASRVRLRLPSRPRQVTIQPGGQKIDSWTFADGQLELTAPGFNIHQMIVADAP